MTGAEHLAILARDPRPAGGPAETRARDHAATTLAAAGFAVTRERFAYSAFPGRFGTPIGGAMAAAAVLGAAWLALARDATTSAAVVLLGGLLLLGGFAAAMLGDGVLTLPSSRATGENLVATRRAEGGGPAVWLVAHLDSKSQPVSSLGRAAGITLLGGAVALALAACAARAASLPDRAAWWAAAAAALLGGPLVMASVVGARSPGALDNASGVAAVLAAAERLTPQVPIGVLLPSAEELGLAGARAWARNRPPGIALNCDGVDDEGQTIIMFSRPRPSALIEAIRRAAPAGAAPPRARRAPPGLLTDAMALAASGWSAVTLSHGSTRSLRRVHGRGDSLAALRGTQVEAMATLLVRVVEALS